jgi:ectoine hydroxylase-related dioxygenase (phytanoyl-CoA dioxygenase family)
MTLAEQIAFFEKNDYCFIPAALSRGEIDRLNAAIDRHRAASPALWSQGARSQSVHCLLDLPEFDFLLTHGSFLPLARAILDGEVVFSEFSVMVRAGSQKPGVEGWHRDFMPNPKHRLGVTGLSAIFYLTDVDEMTARYTLIPGSHAREDAPKPIDDAKTRFEGEAEMLGPAGSCILVNAGIWHAGKWGDGPRERRTVHMYHQSPSVPPVSNHTIIPRRLWDVPDPDRRRFFSHFNELTRAVAGDYAGAGKQEIGKAGKQEMQTATRGTS